MKSGLLVKKDKVYALLKPRPSGRAKMKFIRLHRRQKFFILQGVDVPEKNAPIRTNIYIIKSSDDYSIFGVKYGQKYTKAKELVEQAGFTLVKEGSFNSNTYALTYAKGIAYLEMEIEYEYGETFEDGNVSRIGIRIPIQE